MALVALTAPSTTIAPDRLRQAFGLTAAETRLLSALVTGDLDARAERRLVAGSRDALVTTASRAATILAVVFLLSILPQLSGRDVAVSIYRARFSEGEIDPAALERIRHEIGADGGVFGSFLAWLGKAVRGDFGESWVTHKPVLPDLLTALGTIGAFLYNVTAALVGGLHVTLTDE